MPPLTNLEQVQLGLQIQRGDEKAINKLVKGTMHLVTNRVNYLNHSQINVPLEDIIQEGYVGLIEAAKRFDPVKGLNFETFAHYYIFRYIFRFLDQANNLIAIPNYRSSINRKILKLMEELEQDGLEANTNYLLIHELMSENDIHYFIHSNNPILPEDFDEDGESIFSIIEDEDSPQADYLLEDSINKERVIRLLGILDDKTQLIIKAYYGIGVPQLNCTQIAEEHGEMLGFKSRMRVNQILNQGITTIKQKLKQHEN